MKLDNPIEVDLREFFLDGKFDYIKLGQTKEWIVNNFPDPDASWNDDYSLSDWNIWTYGSLEFHFADNCLFQIWCDGLDSLDRCSQLVYKKWFVDDHASITLSQVANILNTEMVDYSVKHEKNFLSVRMKILKSGVVLYFENLNEDASLTPNDYTLNAFGLNTF